MELELFRIERFSVKNGPGIRTTVFLKGCPLRCAWCANPESQESGGSLLYNPELCLDGCGECLAVCPSSALSRGEGKAEVDRGRCVPCGLCSAACPAKALSLAGYKLTLEALLGETEKDRAFHESSGGGVTLSGGEPLFQTAEVLALLAALKARGVHRVLDTSGEADPEAFREALELSDLVLFDVKLVDPAAHERFTGLRNDRILENLEAASRLKPEALVVRIPLVPGVNDGEEETALFGGLLSNLPKKEVNILPYHRLGAAKYGMLGRSYPLADTKTPSRETSSLFLERLRASGVEASVES